MWQGDPLVPENETISLLALQVTIVSSHGVRLRSKGHLQSGKLFNILIVLGRNLGLATVEVFIGPCVVPRLQNTDFNVRRWRQR